MWIENRRWTRPILFFSSVLEKAESFTPSSELLARILKVLFLNYSRKHRGNKNAKLGMGKITAGKTIANTLPYKRIIIIY